MSTPSWHPAIVAGADKMPRRLTADPLQARARRLWPDSEALQIKWIAAVRMVRTTTNGWVCDHGPLTPKRDA